MNLFDIRGRVIIITGGSGFLGTQYRTSLADAGAVVENFDIDKGIDVTDEDSLHKAVQAVLKKHGHIDGLITNAAANPKTDEHGDRSAWAPYSDFSADLFRRELELNLTGSFLAAKAVSKPMMKAKKGSIIFIGSDLSLIGPSNALYPEGNFKDIAYGVSKAGVLGLMRFWAAFLGPHNVRANALILGGMFRDHDSEFARLNAALNMLGRMSKSGEYNGGVQFLLSDASSYVTGSCLVMDGGRTAL